MAGAGCGTHDRYTAGCPDCQRMTRLYYRRRSAMLAAGTWRHKVDIAVVREHITKLRNDGGMTLAGIARAANLPEQTVYCAANGDRKWVQGGAGYPILDVQPTLSLPTNMTLAVGTTRRVRALIADGFSMSHIGRELDKSVQQIWEDEDADIDEVLVCEVFSGRAPLSALNEAEEAALWRTWERHRRERFLDLPGFTDFARTYNTTAAVAERLRNQADGLNSRGKPRKTTTTSGAAHSRTTERTAA